MLLLPANGCKLRAKNPFATCCSRVVPSHTTVWQQLLTLSLVSKSITLHERAKLSGNPRLALLISPSLKTHAEKRHRRRIYLVSLRLGVVLEVMPSTTLRAWRHYHTVGKLSCGIGNRHTPLQSRPHPAH